MKKHEGNKTTRETYSRLIGYNFGSDEEGNARIYNGAYWDPYTNKKQYEFLYYSEKKQRYVGQYLTDYKGFREVIDQFDYPGRKC